MEFILLGFDQSPSTREFRFEIIKADHCRAPVVVVADLSLAHEHNIKLQDLPLLCRELLQHSEADALSAGLITLTKTHMVASSLAARIASEEKKARRVREPVLPKFGRAWRATLPLTGAPKSVEVPSGRQPPVLANLS